MHVDHRSQLFALNGFLEPTILFGKMSGANYLLWINVRSNYLIWINVRSQLFYLDGCPKPPLLLGWMPADNSLIWMHARDQFPGLNVIKTFINCMPTSDIDAR